MREWFLILGGVMIVGVLAHGAWLFFRARRQAVGVRYERNIPEVDLDDIELLRAELPSGGARVRTTPVDADEAPAKVAPEAPADPAPSRRSGVDLDARVPVLMDPIDRDSAAPAEPAEADEGAAGPGPAPTTEPRPEPPPAPAARDADPESPATPEAEPSPDRPAPGPEPEPEPQPRPDPEPETEPRPASPRTAEPAAEREPEPEPEGIEQTPLFANEPIVPREKPARRREAKSARETKDAKAPKERGRRRGRREAEAPEPSAAPTGPPEDVIVIYVLRRGGGTLAGPDLLEAITDAGLRFGDMNIFHRYAANDRKRIEWSLASAVEPGTFDLGAMDEFATRGVTLFLQLPGPEQPLEALEDMVSVARDLAERLDAEMKDEQHSVMTAQTVEHCRNRIREFARRQMSKRAGH